MKQKKIKRIARGPGSGHGKYCGQGSRAGAGDCILKVVYFFLYKKNLFEVTSLPKKGFKNVFAKKVKVIHFGFLYSKLGTQLTHCQLLLEKNIKKIKDVK